jgi:hypothetical protein
MDKQEDCFAKLPEEIELLIFSFLQDNDLFRLRAVCYHFYSIIDERVFQSAIKLPRWHLDDTNHNKSKDENLERAPIWDSTFFTNDAIQIRHRGEKQNNSTTSILCFSVNKTYQKIVIGTQNRLSVYDLDKLNFIGSTTLFTTGSHLPPPMEGAVVQPQWSNEQLPGSRKKRGDIASGYTYTHTPTCLQVNAESDRIYAAVNSQVLVTLPPFSSYVNKTY